jgi:signal transduction histidine kinase
MNNIGQNKELGSSLNQFAEFRDRELEVRFQEYFWDQRKQYFFISYFICTALFLIHGVFDFKRVFVQSTPMVLMGVRLSFFLVCLHFIYHFKKQKNPKLLYEYCFVLKLFSVLIILLLTLFTGGLSQTLLIGSMIMCSSFYVMLPGRAIYSLISGLCITSVFLILGNHSDPNYLLGSFILLSSNFILWFFCKNQHKYNRLEFLHQNNLKDLGEMKTKMLTTLAHDIRSPLSVIMMRAELGEKGAFKVCDEKLVEHFNRINLSTHKIESLIKDLLNWTFTKSSKTFHLEQPKSSILSTISSSLDYLAEGAEIKNIKFDTNIQDELISHDPTMVETILRNLLSNSIKFSAKDSDIKVYTFLKDEYHIRIYDTGAMLTEEQIKNIESGNTQKSSDGTSGEKGYGVGLTLVTTFLRVHNAKLKISSTPEGGNLFELVFPI